MSRCRDQQALLLVLAVDLDQGPDDGRQPSGGDSFVIDPSHAAPAGADFADADKRLRYAVEQRLHARRLRAVADEAGVGAPTQHQRQRIDEQALARAGLTGDDGEASRKRDAHVLDEGQVADGKLEQAHGQLGRSAASQQLQNGPRGSTKQRSPQRLDLDLDPTSVIPRRRC